MSSESLTRFVDDIPGVLSMLRVLQSSEKVHLERGLPLILAVDLEGMNSSDTEDATKQKCACLSVACVDDGKVFGRESFGCQPRAWIVDIASLGEAALTTALDSGDTLHSFLSREDTVKLFWDARFDVFTLFRGHAVAIPDTSVVDLQVVAMAYLRRSTTWLMGLNSRSLDTLLGTSSSRIKDSICWLERIEYLAGALWKESDGGDVRVWRHRPIDPVLVEYASGDVVFMHDLLWRMREYVSMSYVQTETRNRVAEGMTAEEWKPSQARALNPGRHWSFKKEEPTGLAAVLCAL